MHVSEEQFKKDLEAFHTSRYTFSPDRDNWATVVRLLHNHEKMPQDYDKIFFNDMLKNHIEEAYRNRDIKYLKKIFPEATDLIAHGHALWIMTHAKGARQSDKTPKEFIEEIFKEYKLDDQPELKKQLLLQRGPNGKYAADGLVTPETRNALLLKDRPNKKTTKEQAINQATDFMQYHNITIEGTDIVIRGSSIDNRNQKYKELAKILETAYGFFQNGLAVKSNNKETRAHFKTETARPIVEALSNKLKEKQQHLGFNMYVQRDAYQFLKEQIKAVEPEPTKEDIHRIGPEYNDPRIEDRQATGTPVSGGLWLTDHEGNLVAYRAGSIKETYPEIRLRNIGDENKKEQSVTLKELNPNSKKSLVEQVMEKTDFPEDFQHHFNALSIWEKDYQEARKDEERFSYIRYFTQNKGAYIFEDKKDKTVKGNGKEEGGNYNGYAGMRRTSSGEEYPCIVCRSDMLDKKPDKTFFHELYHRVDLHNGLKLSDQALTQFTFMLCETNNNNSFKSPFVVASSVYPPSEFEKEALAQIMSYETDKHFENNPLLTEFYKTGKLFALAKADKVPAMEHRVSHALYDMPELSELWSMYNDFKQEKKDAYNEEKNLKSKYSGAELAEKLRDHNTETQQKNEQKNTENEPTRARLETALLDRLQKLNQSLREIHSNKEITGDICIPPHIIHKFEELRDQYSPSDSHQTPEYRIGNFRPKEITPKALEEQVARLGDDLPDMQFLRLYTTIDTLHKMGYSTLSGIPTVDTLKSFKFDDKHQTLVDKLRFVSDEISKGSHGTDIELACFFNKPVKELTDDDRLKGYLKKGYSKSSEDYETFRQAFIEKLEKNGYDPDVISETVFQNIDWDDNDDEIVKEISFPENRRKAGKIIDYLDKNYTPETLAIIAKPGGEKRLEEIPPEKRYRQPISVLSPTGHGIMFPDAHAAKKYINNPNTENKMSKILAQLSPQQNDTGGGNTADYDKSTPAPKPVISPHFAEQETPAPKPVIPFKNGGR